MTFVLQLHFVKMKLNLKQKMQKKSFAFWLFIVRFLTPSYWTALPSELGLFVPDVSLSTVQ